MSQLSIETIDLRRVFKPDRTARREGGEDIVALDGVSLAVNRGELFGLLGPNGAGKTTAIRILCTLLSPTSGRALVEGLEVERNVWEVRRLINMVSGGETCGYGILTAIENLRLFTELYGIPWKTAKPQVEYMLKVVGLDKFPGVKVNRLSTGMRQRLNFARGFTTDPKVLFLDEPTVGMDVHSAREVRGFIRRWMADNPGRTVLLTTHYMAEADEMCDRIAIIDEGRVRACDTPDALKRMLRRETALDLTLAGLKPPPEEWNRLPGVASIAIRHNHRTETTVVHVLLEGPDASGDFLRAATRDGRHILDLTTRQPSLEDVFIKLTGRTLTEKPPEGEAAV